MTIYPKNLLLLGSGELGKEVAIAAKRLGCNIIACDRYANAPAMQVADISEILDMTNPDALTNTILKHSPDYVIPEIEALSVEALKNIEARGIKVIPNARATDITMNRDKIRNLAANDLGLTTAKYAYASSINELKEITENFGWPLIIKPVMSSSGKGQSLVKKQEDVETAWKKAIEGSRGKSTKVIVEEFINFELEITLLTIRQQNGPTLFCPPIGHEQIKGDYQCSWQPATLTDEHLKTAQAIAKDVTDNLGGEGIFGVEFFITKEEVIFSELSPRPHDTGLVTIISQNLSEFELHLRAVLGLPIPEIKGIKPAASRVVLSKEIFSNVGYKGIEKALSETETEVLIFGKPNAEIGRRMGVCLATGTSVNDARSKADKAAQFIEVIGR